MKFVVDNQLPPALAVWLSEKGHQAQHVFLLGMAESSDSSIWDWASANDAIVVTKDADFAERRSASVSGPILLWLRVGNTTTPFLLARLEALWSEIEVSLGSGQSIVEVR